MQRWIMHVDMDAFFASVEQFDNPDLMGLPVIVGGQSDRGVVSTCSYEARVYGVHSAMPMIEARRLCPQAVFLPGRMKRYQEVSRQIMNIFDSFSPLVEQLSVDEAFLDISGMELLAGSERDIGFKVKRSIKEKTGLTASVGIAPNKFLAKLASDMQKPDGLVVIRAEEAEGMLKPMSVRRIFGIGRSAEKSLLQFGIATIGQIADADLGILHKALGNNAAVVKQLAHGLDDRPVVNDYAAKSIGKECTFEKDLHTEDERRHAVLDLCGRVGWRLRRSGVVGYTVTLKVKFASFKIITRSITAEGPVAYDEEIFALAQKLMQSVKWIEGVRLLGVSVAHLEPADAVPVLNFAEDERLGKRNQAVDISLVSPAGYLHPKPMLMPFLMSGVGVLGYMGPFFTEYNLNPDLLPVQYPFTYAHEMAHVLGISSEAEANLYGFLVCSRSGVPEIRFSAYFALLPYVLSNAYGLLSEEEFNEWKETISPEVKDLYNRKVAYWENLYSPFIGEIQSTVYNWFLKGNNIPSGRKNYSEVVALLMALGNTSGEI